MTSGRAAPLGSTDNVPLRALRLFIPRGRCPPRPHLCLPTLLMGVLASAARIVTSGPGRIVNRQTSLVAGPFNPASSS